MMSELNKSKGVTLVEILLVVSIISAILYMGIGYIQQRTLSAIVDRTAIQMQQILNAGLSYYVNNAEWPADLATLQTDNYLPVNMSGPYGTTYEAAVSPANNSIFVVSLTLPQTITGVKAIGLSIAGKLPLSSSTTDGSGDTLITTSVNIPGQNLANATAVNFAGLYHNGACVPVPSCPLDNNGNPLEADIIVAPVSVSGMSDTGSTNVYPLTSINAFAQDAVDLTATGGIGPTPCPSNTTGNGNPSFCYADNALNQITDGKYWRVCLAAITSKGDVVWDGTTGLYGTVMVITRCSNPNEDSGSGFDYWAY